MFKVSSSVIFLFLCFFVSLFLSYTSYLPVDMKDSTITYYNSLNYTRIKTIFDKEDRWLALHALQGKHSQRTLPLLLSSSCLFTDPSVHQTRAEKRGRAAVLYRHGQAIPPKKIADVMEALIGAYYQDCGVQGVVGFLDAVGVLRGGAVKDALTRDALRKEFSGAGQANFREEVVVEKWKRRKLTAINSLLISGFSVEEGLSSSISSVFDTTHSIHSTHSTNTQLPIAIQSIDNVTPNLPPPSSFPYAQLESLLNYTFSDRKLLFQAFTHCSGVDGVVVEGDNEVLEWIGDAALDWAVCRYFWYGIRGEKGDDDDDDVDDVDIGIGDILDVDKDILHHAEEMSENFITSNSQLDFYKCLITNFDTTIPEYTRPHPVYDILPLSPDDLTRARQSITNNDALAKITVHFGLHRYLRIDSMHLQREIEKFSRIILEGDGEVERVEGKKIDRYLLINYTTLTLILPFSRST